MRRLSRGLVAAIEEQEVIAAATNQVAVPEAAESLESDLLEVQDSAAEGAVQENEVDDAVEVTEALEAYAHALESIQGQGGLDRNGAMMMQIGLEALYVRAGIAARNISMPSMESYGGTSTRINSTKLALEGIQEKAKEIWAAIVKAIKRAIEWVMEHFNKVFGSAEKLQKRAEALGTQAESITGKAKEASFENAGLVKKLHISGQMSNIANGVKALNAIASDVLGKGIDDKIKLAENFSELIDSSDTAVAGFTVMPSSTGTKVGDSEGFSAPQGMAVYRSPELFGGMAGIGVDAAEKVTGVAAMDVLAKAYNKIDKFDPKAKEVSATKVPTLSVTDVQTITKEVQAIGETLQQFRKPFAKLQAALKDVASKAEKASSKADSEEDAEKKKTLVALRKGCANVPRFVSSGPAALAGYSLNTGKALLDYCELSLKQYEAK